jgi:hypothetical protein
VRKTNRVSLHGTDRISTNPDRRFSATVYHLSAATASAAGGPPTAAATATGTTESRHKEKRRGDLSYVKRAHPIAHR